MKIRIEVFVRLTLFAALFATSLSAQTYLYPTSWACGGIIRARVVSANASTITFEVQKAINNCSGTTPFDPPGGQNTASIRSGSAGGAILASKTYYKNDPSVVIAVPGFTSGSRSFVATIDAYSTPVMTVSVVLPDDIGSWQNVPASANAGATIALQAQVKNAGGGNAGPSYACFAYSLSSAITAANAIRIGNAMAVAPLAPNASSPSLTAAWTIPSSLAGTTIYVAIQADCNGNVAESNEANNFYTPATMLRVGGPVIGPLLEVKIGVVAWLHAKSVAEQRTMVDEIIRDVGNGATTLTGNGRKVNLVITADMTWKETQPTRGVEANFSRWVTFAQICREKGVRFSPQFSPHTLPQWVEADYAADLQTPRGFLPLAVSSAAWKTPAQSWIRKGIRDFADQNLFAAGGPIDEVFVGNEIHYETKAVSDADASRRALALANMVAGLVDAARLELDTRGASRVAVGSKLISYLFAASRKLESSYTADSLRVLDSSFRGIFPIDSYAKSASGAVCTAHDWLVSDDIAAAKNATQRTIALAEFNYDRGKCANMPAQAIVDTIRDGLTNRVTYFTFFAWNPADSTWTMGPDQKSGLRQAFYATVGK